MHPYRLKMASYWVCEDAWVGGRGAFGSEPGQGSPVAPTGCGASVKSVKKIIRSVQAFGRELSRLSAVSGRSATARRESGLRWEADSREALRTLVF